MTIKHGNRLKHENEPEGHGSSASVSFLSLFPHLYWSKSKILFYACVDEGCSGLQGEINLNPLHLRWSKVENSVSCDVITGKIYLFLNNSQIHSDDTRNANSYRRPHTCRTHIKKLKIIYQGPKIWNSLSSRIKSTDSLNLFKIFLHCFLLNE